MRFVVIALSTLLAAAPVAAQDNPFAFTGGSVKSAYIVYDLTSKQQNAAGATYEIGVAPDRWIMRMMTPIEMGGKKDTIRILAVTTRDSQYTYHTMGSQGEGQVNPTLRPFLAREYAALGSAEKARFRENVKLVTSTPDFGSSSSEADAFITLTGEKTGSETISGHQCDVYKQGQVTACVIPQAPLVMLRWSDEKQGLKMVAKKVTLNGPIPAVAKVLPKGVRWKKESYDDADFVAGIWEFKKQTDPAGVGAAQVTKFVVDYLASPAAAAELREMSAGMGGDEPASEDESGEDQGSEE